MKEKIIDNIQIFTTVFLLFIFIVSNQLSMAQRVPSVEENIPFLVTFGKDSDTSWGDNNFRQTFFALIPKDHRGAVYIRVFDPDTGGKYDEVKGVFDTKTKFMVYGGINCWSSIGKHPAQSNVDIYKGILLASKTFGNDPKYDGKWYTFGPFNPAEGEFVEKFNGYVFKIIAEGGEGDDGNLYRYFLSTNDSENIEVEGGNMFTYEYTFRLSDNIEQISQIYPYIDDETISIKISNFDWDNDGEIKIISVAKSGVYADVSGEDNWAYNEFPIVEEEKNTSIQIQFIKNRKQIVKNNNVTIIVQNQYGEFMPFYVLPIGGIPVFTPKIKMKPAN